jgi:hypothetical protein
MFVCYSSTKHFYHLSSSKHSVIDYRVVSIELILMLLQLWYQQWTMIKASIFFHLIFSFWYHKIELQSTGLIKMSLLAIILLLVHCQLTIAVSSFLNYSLEYTACYSMWDIQLSKVSLSYLAKLNEFKHTFDFNAMVL